LKIILVSYFYP